MVHIVYGVYGCRRGPMVCMVYACMAVWYGSMVYMGIIVYACMVVWYGSTVYMVVWRIWVYGMAA